VLRPLIGDDKADIVARARRIGTYDISAEPHQDTCGLFAPRRPATRSNTAQVDAAEAGVDVGALVAACLAGAEEREAVPLPAGAVDRSRVGGLAVRGW
jgi:thiamine biosynthesis protein ThiI